MFPGGTMSRPGSRGPGRRPSQGRLYCLLLAAALAGSACSGPDTGASAALVISEARVRALIPGQDKTAGYFSARNGTADAVVLSGARSEQARSIEMHVTVQDGDMMRMRRLEAVEIAPGETVRFEPGGRHLMVFGVDSLEAGMDIDLELGDGTTVPVHFETIATGGES